MDPIQSLSPLAEDVLKRPAIVIDFVNSNGVSRGVKASSSDGKIELGRKLVQVLTYNNEAQTKYLGVSKKTDAQSLKDIFGDSTQNTDLNTLSSKQQSIGDDLTLAIINTSVEKSKGPSIWMILILIGVAIAIFFYLKKSK